MTTLCSSWMSALPSRSQEQGQQRQEAVGRKRSFYICPTSYLLPPAPEIMMARVAGIEKRDAPWHLRWFYGALRKMFGKDLTPVKIQMRVPGIVWGSIAMEAGLGRKRKVSLRYIQLAKVRTAARVGCPF